MEKKSRPNFTLILLFLFAVCFITFPGCSKSDPIEKVAPSVKSTASPPHGRMALDPNGQMQIGAQDRCPVCGMQVIKYPKFSCAVQLRDGRTFYFCGTGCMIRSWMHPEVFLAAPKDDLKRAVVRDYFSGNQVDALSVFWVAGSDVLGPMGPALVPVTTEAELAAFKKRHGGNSIFRLAHMNDHKWQEITGKKAVPEDRTSAHHE